jgi:hypothetical protein
MIYQRCAAPVRTRAAQREPLRQATRRYYDLNQQKANLVTRRNAAQQPAPRVKNGIIRLLLAPIGHKSYFIIIYLPIVPT